MPTAGPFVQRVLLELIFKNHPISQSNTVSLLAFNDIPRNHHLVGPGQDICTILGSMNSQFRGGMLNSWIAFTIAHVGHLRIVSSSSVFK